MIGHSTRPPREKPLSLSDDGEFGFGSFFWVKARIPLLDHFGVFVRVRSAWNRVTSADCQKLHCHDHGFLEFKRGLLWMKIRHEIIAEEPDLNFQAKNAFQKTPSINIERISSFLVRPGALGVWKILISMRG